MGAKFKGCAAYIYDEAGKLLVRSTVTAHNAGNSSLDIPYADGITDQANYELLIMTTPSPFAFSCIAGIDGDRITLKLLRGEVREQRSSVRYEINGNATVVAYLYEGRAYALHTPQEAVLVNISKGGVRLKMKKNSLSIDDLVHVNIQIGDKPKILTAHVVNLCDIDDSSEYGCELLKL